MSVAQPEKGVIGQMSDMAKQRAMTSALDKGQETVMAKLATDPLAKTGTELAGTELAKIGLGGATEEALIGNALAQGTTGAATTGAMAGLGAAVPYLGAGILAGKALGFFNKGGAVGPLYAAEGRPAFPSYNDMDDDELDEMLKKMSPKEQDDFIKNIGLEEAMDAYYMNDGGPMNPQTMGYNRNRMSMPISNVSRPGQDLSKTFYGNRQFNSNAMNPDRRAMAINRMRQFMAGKPAGPSQDISQLRNRKRDVVNPGRGGK
ncbi:hypothetical protein OAV41_01755 [Planctomycetota bacterium]|nr:hypothetical protein [Planctomycetota bacterium]